MNIKKGSIFRSVLLWIYLLSFAICVAMIFILHDKKRIEAGSGTPADPNYVKMGLLQIYSSYSTYLAILVAFYFNAKRTISTSEQEQQVGTAFWIALFSSLIWNAAIVLSLAKCWYGGTIAEALDIIGYWGTIFSFLPALFVGLYVANPTAIES